jgi:hypothetical protein
MTTKSKSKNKQADQTSSQAGAEKTTNPRKHTGAARRAARAQVGAVKAFQAIGVGTPAKSAAAQLANARSQYATGRKERADAKANAEAFKAVKAYCVKYASELTARGLPAVAVHGAELNCDQLAIIVEVEALSATPIASTKTLDQAAFVSKRRDGINRLAPGAPNAPFRAKFGLDEPIRVNQPSTVMVAAQRMLAGKKAMPESRAAQLITAEDEKHLRAIVKSIDSDLVQTKKTRKSSAQRTTERNILNTATELFYDDFAATIGVVLEDDEVARIAALELVPRRAETRAATDTTAPGAGGSSGAGATGSGSAGSAAPVNSEAAVVKS